jgi:adenine-specific DNA-methyltransferase
MTAAKERRFFDALRDVFIGVPVEGESGYINLMRIKARYFQRVLEPHLQRAASDEMRALRQSGATDTEVEKVREEIFDKLYTFFRRYFTESGSLGFFFTPYHQSIYERVYTDDRDVMLFWKTSRLYYVKTDRLFRSMEVSIDRFRFFFDVSGLEHKKANEKRELVYTFRERRDDGTLVFSVSYSERGTQTKIDDIRRAVRDALGLKKYTDAIPSEEILERAFRIFERQSQVDYFICKDARSFLREQFDLWLWQYLLGRPGEEPQTEWTEARLRHLQALKRLAYLAIDLVAAFEDELVRIWNKPKFVLRSGYVITLDRVYDRDPQLVDRLVAHPGWAEQVREWRDLGIVGEGFSAGALWEHTLEGRRLHLRYRYLPVDTRYFKDLELAILALFDPLDDALDGWLIHSENYQALKTLLPKWNGRVHLIYIDPPFNLGEDADYWYSVNYKDSTWLSLLEARLALARRFLHKSGSIFVRVGHDGNMLVRMLMDHVFGAENYRNEIIVRRAEEAKGEFTKQFRNIRSLTVNYDNLYWYSAHPETRYPHIFKTAEGERGRSAWHSFWKAEDRPNLRYELLGIDLQKGQWMWSRERAMQAVENYEKYLAEAQKTGESLEEYWERTGRKLEFIKREGEGIGSVKYWIPPRSEVVVDNNWLDIKGYANIWRFKTENSEILLGRIMQVTNPGDVCMDFFLGSGTTVATAHKMGRKWIGVEVSEHIFGALVLPRMKKVLWGEPSGISREVNWQGGGFFKYYELEQYEDTLRRTRYLENDLFTPPPTEDPCQYLFLRDPKMLEALEVDLESGAVQLDLSRLYPEIDLAETLSNLLGKPIRRIYPDPNDPTRPGRVEFTDGTSEDLVHPDWRRIKPLIWW